MDSLACALIKRSLKIQIVVRSGIWLLVRKPAKRWKLNRSSNWNSICSSQRLNSYWISSTRTISSVGNGGRPPRSRPRRWATRSTSAASAAKSTCYSITRNASPSLFSFSSRSSAADRLDLIIVRWRIGGGRNVAMGGDVSHYTRETWRPQYKNNGIFNKMFLFILL